MYSIAEIFSMYSEPLRIVSAVKFVYIVDEPAHRTNATSLKMFTVESKDYHVNSRKQFQRCVRAIKVNRDQ